ncbi:hypothetical protein ACOMHN_017401 [Nucella lapillus]
MSSIKQNIRSVLADVESFLVETLKSVKLNSGARDQKDRLLERIWQLLEEFPGSASSQLDSSASGGSLKISGAGMQRGEKETTFDPSSAFTQPPPADGPAFPPATSRPAVGNAPLSSKHPTQLPTTDCLLSIIPLMGGQPSDAPALSPPSPLQQGGQSSNAPALSPPSPLPQGGQPIALALSPSSPPPQDGQPSDAPGLSPSSSTLLLCPSDSTLSICHLNSQSAVKTGGDSGSGGTSSSNLQTLGDDDSGYADNIPKKAASELKNKLQTGTLEKKKKTGFRTWDALYCVVSGNVFYMYKKQGDSKQKEAFCLSGYECHEAPGLEKDTSKKEMCFEVTKAGAPTYQFRAGSKEGMVIWKEAITKGIQIATDEEPGAESNLYDDADLYLEPGHRSYEALHQIKSNSDDDDGIYDDLDNLPSFHAPPVPRASTLPPLPAKGRELGGGYANLSPNVHAAAAEEKPKPSSANRASSGTMVHADTTAAVSNVFAKSKSAEKPVLPSEIKKEIARGGGVGNKPQGPPPMIDIFKQSARENTANNTPGKAESDSAVISQTSASGANFTKAATGQANNKSPSANANKNPGLELKSPPAANTNNNPGLKLKSPPAANGNKNPGLELKSPPAANTNNNPGLKLKSPPAANGNKNPGLKSPSSHPNKNRDLPAPPTAGDGKLAKDSSAESSRDAPPARGPGDQDSGGDFPLPPPSSAFDDPEDIYEECGDNQELEAMASTPTFKPTPPPSQPLEAPDEMYDDCESSAVDTAKPGEKKSEPPPPPPPGRRRDPPAIPPPTSDPFPPPPPPPKSELPPVPTCPPPPIPDRKGGTADAPPLPSNRPPLPGRSGAGVRVPQLRKPFMDRDEDFENVYYSKWDCSADTGKELGFKQGDTIHVLSRDFDAESWWVGELDGKVGLVPKEYLCPAFQLVP